jgi:hypothetical protein
VPDSTARYRAATRYSYARALLELVTYAREHSDDFSFGPLDLSVLEHQGLAVSGPDLAGVTELLGKVPGLISEKP